MQRMERLLMVAVDTVLFLCMALNAFAMQAPGDVGARDPAVTGNTGAAEFQIPIAVPPGSGGLAPNVQLTYSSRSGDGPFGVGWDLGLPDIRCSDRFGVPDYATCETFEFSGTLLVEDPAIENKYHTFVESFQRIRYDTTGDYWTVERPDGTVLFLGQLASHRISQGGETARWLLQRTEDSFGNSIFFEYDTTSDIGSSYPANIFYGAAATRTSGPREVRFKYEPRPDGRHIFTGGIEQKLTRRLREIQVFGNNQMSSRHVFGYDLGGSPTTDRSRLSWAQEFGTDCADLAVDPVIACNGLPRREFRYRDANDISSTGVGSQYDSNDAYRIPFGRYHSNFNTRTRRNFPQLIGDLDGDGLLDRIQLEFFDDFLPATVIQVFMNTGSGFSDDPVTHPLVETYKSSFESLEYDQLYYDYQLIPKSTVDINDPDALWWVVAWTQDQTMHAMCSVTPRTREATLAQELMHDGLEAETTGTYSELVAAAPADGAPFAGSIEPRPTVKLVDLDSDGLADLVLSVRIGGMKRHFDCDGTPLAFPEFIPAVSTTVVFRNTGSGWVNDAAAQALADGLPPFEELIVASSYQTELENPSLDLNWWHADGFGARSTCANASYFGFEQEFIAFGAFLWDWGSTVCNNPIDLAPQFVDFNGDGYLDLAVLERDDPDLLWTGAGPIDNWSTGSPNYARTRVWIQDPNASPRWIRAEQYDLPMNMWSVPSPEYGAAGFAHFGLVHIENPDYHVDFPRCVSWSSEPDFSRCGPATYRLDRGVRLVDINGDGLTDVVWKYGRPAVPDLHPEPLTIHEGVLLNTGTGSSPFSAWCASNSADAAHVGSECLDAAAYLPPDFLAVSQELGSYAPSSRGTSAGMLADLNGDGFLDFVRLRWLYQSAQAWIHSPGGATAGTVWRRDDRFDFPVEFGRSVERPNSGGQIVIPVLSATPFNTYFHPAYTVFDINGDGSADLVADQNALLSRSRFSDLLRQIDNGRGGVVDLEYEPSIWQKDAALEIAAEPGPLPPETPDGGDVTLWRPTPVVSRVSVTGDGFADSSTQYSYARPRFCIGQRSNLGFRLVERTRPDGATVEEYFYQDHGRAGREFRRLVKDGGAVVHRFEATWEHVAGPIPGTISAVHNGRLVSDESSNEYGGVSGAILKRTFSYDDDIHGYNFVSSIRTERSTGILLDLRTPNSDFTSYVVGRNATQTLVDVATGVTLRDTEFTYVDLDTDPTGPKLGGRRENIGVRGSGQSNPVDVTKNRYDTYGNLTEEQTPSPTGVGTASTFHCYDGDTGWCPSPTGQSSLSVRVATQHPPLIQGAPQMVTTMTPDARSGIIIGEDSAYTDQPTKRITLDPFGRAEFEYVTPTGGSEVLVATNIYDDTPDSPLRIEREDYADAAQNDWVYSATIANSFGGDWKTITATPSGYVGTATFTDAANRLSRSTLPFDCDGDSTCALLSGEEAELLAIETVSDAIGRPIRVDTPDGFSLMAYSVESGASPGGLAGPGPFDNVLVKNGKGDLIQRVTDVDRIVWVDECKTGVAFDLTPLGNTTCGAADTTLNTYEATGEIYTVYDARAVALGSFSDANHRLRYTYDTLGRITKIEDPDLDGPGFSSTTYNYAGLQDSATSARGGTSNFTYDILGRLVTNTTPSGEDNYIVSYRPTEFQREKDSSEAYERLRTYDEWGRVKQTQLSVLENSTPLVGNWSATYLTDFEYDITGRLVKVVHPESTTIQYEYEGAYLKKVCDLGAATDCLGSGVVKYVSNVVYDELGRRKDTVGAAGTRSFLYDGNQARLVQDRFDASSDPDLYWFQRNYTGYDGIGNVTTITGTTSIIPADIEMNESYTYDTRNRLDSWTKGQIYDYDYDDLGNLTINADVVQDYGDLARPHAIKKRANGTVDYDYDYDGNVISIVGAGGAQYFTFDSANRLTCIDESVASGCGVSRIHYDVDGVRVLDDKPEGSIFVAYVDDSVRINESLGTETRIEILAFGERIAFKKTTDTIRSASLIPFTLPPGVPLLLGILGLASFLAYAQQRGELELVIRRPISTGVSAVVIVALIFAPIPVAEAGGGGTTIYWQMEDSLGTGMLLVDETGARVVHRTYTPFGTEHESAGSGAGGWMLRNYAGHLVDEDSGLVYMQARWMDPKAGRFMSVDPLVRSTQIPQSANPYSYTENNPVNGVDPTGMILGWSGPSGRLVGYSTTAVGYVQREWTTTLTTSVDAAGNVTTTMVESEHIKVYHSLEPTGPGLFQAIADAFQVADVSQEGGSPTEFIGRTIEPGGIPTDNFRLVGDTRSFGQQMTDSYLASTQFRVAEAIGALYGAAGIANLARGMLTRSAVQFGAHKSATKWANQMAKRGWTKRQINEAIRRGEHFKAPNDINPGNGATRFVHPSTGRSVVQDNVTKEILQVGGDGFKF